MNVERLRSKFSWPLAKDLPFSLKGQQLYKQDLFLECVENLINNQLAWSPIIGGTKRTEPEHKLERWINNQIRKMDSLENLTGWNKGISMSVDEFPLISGNKRIIATSRTILYLVDSTEYLVNCMDAAFGPETKVNACQVLDSSLAALLFVSNSIESGGRAFKGDPFTGEVAAFSAIFCYDILRGKERNFVTYYPHQLYTQFFDAGGRKLNNKGVNVLQSLADLIITAKGIPIDPREWRVL